MPHFNPNSKRMKAFKLLGSQGEHYDKARPSGPLANEGYFFPPAGRKSRQIDRPSSISREIQLSYQHSENETDTWNNGEIKKTSKCLVGLLGLILNCSLHNWLWRSATLKYSRGTRLIQSRRILSEKKKNSSPIDQTLTPPQYAWVSVRRVCVGWCKRAK